MFTLQQIYLQYTYKGSLKEIRLQSDQLQYANDDLQIQFHIEEALSGEQFFAIVENETPIVLEKLELTFKEDYDRVKAIFANGFQSWSESKLYKKTDKIPPLKKFARKIMNPYGDYTYHEYSGKPGEIHSWGYTYMTLPQKRILFIGSLDEKNAYTNFIHYSNRHELVVSRDVKGWEIQGSTKICDFFQTENSEFGTFQHYFMLCKYPEPKVEPAIGWTSWYYYYTKISEKIALENLENFKKNHIPLQIFQIDDGYQTRVGDWLSVNQKFPRGMKFLADEIKAAGYRPGIWLAPLSAEKKSDIVKNHPDWLLKDESGKPVRIGINPLWSMAFYALDIYHPEVRAYIKKVFHTVCREWGYDIVKLDFLYGACLLPRNGRSRAGVMADAMALLREAIGEDKIILGCGIPMGTAAGTTDYCRIGADVHLTWDIKLLKWCNNRERAATVLAATNTINRRQLNKNAFVSDPDVFMLRKKFQRLTRAEQYTLLLTNLLFGDLIFNSDNIAEYDTTTMDLYRSIFPLVKRKEVIVEHSEGLYKIFFQVDDRRYMAYINLSEKDKLYKLPSGIYFDAQQQIIMSNEQTITIPKHQSLLLHICSAGPFGVIGTKGHFFTGSEIKKIALVGEDIKIELRPGLLFDPEVFLKVPKDYSGKTINGIPFKMIQKKDFAIIQAVVKRDENSST